MLIVPAPCAATGQVAPEEQPAGAFLEDRFLWPASERAWAGCSRSARAWHRRHCRQVRHTLGGGESGRAELPRLSEEKDGRRECDQCFLRHPLRTSRASGGTRPTRREESARTAPAEAPASGRTHSGENEGGQRQGRRAASTAAGGPRGGSGRAGAARRETGDGSKPHFGKPGAAGDGDWRRVLRGAAAQERWLWRVGAASGGEQMKMRQLGRAEGRCRG